MSTIRIVLHVGMPKCGTSALQFALSKRPDLSGRRKYRYAAFLQNKVFFGEVLSSTARTLVSGYLASQSVDSMLSLGEEDWAAVSRSLAALSSDGHVPILSSEAWGGDYGRFSCLRLLERLGVEAEVVLYVRPQVRWLNSAWWQWGAWGDMPLVYWVNQELPYIHWHRIVAGWRLVPGVVSVQVRLLPEDIVSDFVVNCLGVEDFVSPAGRKNVSLPAELLRHLQRHRELRPGKHDAGIDFVAERHLILDESATPWVIPRPMIKRVIETCRAGNEALIESLSSEQQLLMTEDAHWWSEAAYAGRRVEPWRAQAPEAVQLDALLAAALGGLIRLDAENRQLLAFLMKSRRG